MENQIEKIRIEHNRILFSILNNDIKKERGIGIYTGLSGDIIFLAQNYIQDFDDKILDKINELLDCCLEYLEIGEYNNPTFSAGIAGYAWVVNYLVENEIIDKDSNEVLEVLDPFLKREIKNMLIHQNYDLLNGALGIGIYFLKRKDFGAVEELIEYLDDRKIKIGNEYLWEVDKRQYQMGFVFDFSLAHGAAGILYFLNKCEQQGIRSATCQKLIDGILCFFQNNLQDHEKIGSYFGNRIDRSEYYSNSKTEMMSRVGWCYGDLSILHTINGLLSSSYGIGHLRDEAASMLKNTAKRFSVESSLVCDAGFCHGSSGNAFIFRDLFLKTDIEEFRLASEFWIDKTISFLKSSGDEQPKYVFIGGENSMEVECDNLLEGTLGIGITYNYFLFNNLPAFKDIFMLS
ncbi:Lanthionine synthetase C-like protein [Pedobacter terrae]|uniref:Lanthionine synthetase C-like protein n=1 Tax=Pedobacter terrae TaxID=405671 RepID=A0A1G8CJS0_9SPHI|nr:lanthionine synthetase LanC family protein [Pedobacter terrae]SDH45589.1 Lanthionine synthetase C-like protein [Pedobacter terrae]